MVFFSKSNFKKHLEIEADKVHNSKDVDFICNKLHSIDHSRVRLRKEGENQCLYCEYGTDIQGEKNKF